MSGTSEVILTKSRIRPGKTDRLREWTDEIRAREDEALETLQHEGMHAEAAFVEHAEDGDYLVYYMEADDIEEVFEAFEESPHEIDREHREVMHEVLVGDDAERTIEPLYHLVNPEKR
ncbi:DUF6176 family protein [Haloprofundus salilacus]|uniref:DUF6176 family protein n=1 Tax=Haloprofundus salilacus TaxID=2876190 RepID=UPI001CCE1466|nr:DUF6176 family protein [Haloprofundus salilacus]